MNEKIFDIVNYMQTTTYINCFDYSDPHVFDDIKDFTFKVNSDKIKNF